MITVGSSNWAGARSATDHLITLGHRRIAWIGGPDASTAARDRFHGYRAALDSAGIDLDPTLVRSGRFDVGAGARHARDLLTTPRPPTAVMAADDELAVGVLATAHELGLPVPQQLSVVGFDDTPQAAWTTPPLTTVRQDLDGMGRLAVQTVLALSSGEHPPSRHIELATTLSVRGTTGPPGEPGPASGPGTATLGT
jgi:LacI family transcriptional regulator